MPFVLRRIAAILTDIDDAPLNEEEKTALIRLARICRYGIG